MAEKAEMRERPRLSEATGIILGAIIAAGISVLTTCVNNRAEETREVNSHFREARRQLYANFIQEMQEMYSEEERVERDRWLEPQASERADLASRRLKIAILGDEIMIFGGEVTRDRVPHEIAPACGELANGPDANNPAPKSRRERCAKAMAEFISLARKDLGL